ncbi:hypothetical protein HAX54_028199 [Datura stramonium]|uniref:Uncharacterized protein n=1 Tax=Datura stramonium TaxID=4076 RepID=A0ABS8V3N6_DATST|nr:hypothetical protein [Datura stramonium]
MSNPLGLKCHVLPDDRLGDAILKVSFRPLLGYRVALAIRRLVVSLPLSPVDYWYAQYSSVHQRVSGGSRTPPATRRYVADVVGSD